jgi:hypothetical protein
LLSIGVLLILDTISLSLGESAIPASIVRLSESVEHRRQSREQVQCSLGRSLSVSAVSSFVPV